MNRLPRLAPAPLRQEPLPQPRVTFYDLPAELRIEVYRLALEGVIIHILPPPAPNASERPQILQKQPHALIRTSHQVRNEVLPMIHSLCPIECPITDFNFDGLLLWMSRVPPDQEVKLKKNDNLTIHFNTTSPSPPKALESMRKWLHMRADKCRPYPNWQYSGATPPSKTCADLRRRAKRMREDGKQAEMFVILKALQIPCGDESAPGGGRSGLQ